VTTVMVVIESIAAVQASFNAIRQVAPMCTTLRQDRRSNNRHLYTACASNTACSAGNAIA